MSLEEIKKIAEGIEKTVAEGRAAVSELEERVKKAGESEAELKENTRKFQEDAAKQLQELKKEQEETRKQIARSTLPSGQQMTAEQQELKEKSERSVSAYLRARGNFERLNEEDRENVRLLLTNKLEQRGVSGLVDTEGGFLVPTLIESQILKIAYQMSVMRQLVTARPVSTNKTEILTMSQVKAAWGREQIQFPDDDVNFKATDINIYDIKAGIGIPNNLLDDSAVNLIAELSDAYGQKFAEMEDAAFAFGTGFEQPRGLFTSTALTGQAYNRVNNAGTLTITHGYIPTKVAAALSDSSNNGGDQLTVMWGSLKKAYLPNAKWLMNSLTQVITLNLKDQYGQYLWRINWSNIAGDAPTLLLNKPVYINEFIDSVAANKYPIAFGDFSRAFAIRDRMGMSIKVYEQTLAKQDKTLVLAKKRTGGELVLPEAMLLMKVAAS